jgi:hypothetical protein
MPASGFSSASYPDITGHIQNGVLIAMRDGVEIARSDSLYVCGGGNAVKPDALDELARYLVYLMQRGATP